MTRPSQSHSKSLVALNRFKPTCRNICLVQTRGCCGRRHVRKIYKVPVAKRTTHRWDPASVTQQLGHLPRSGKSWISAPHPDDISTAWRKIHKQPPEKEPSLGSGLAQATKDMQSKAQVAHVVLSRSQRVRHTLPLHPGHPVELHVIAAAEAFRKGVVLNL